MLVYFFCMICVYDVDYMLFCFVLIINLIVNVYIYFFLYFQFVGGVFDFEVWFNIKDLFDFILLLELLEYCNVFLKVCQLDFVF